MKLKNIWGEHKCFGSLTVSPRGQVVIPASARRELAINTGDTFLVFNAFRGKGLILFKAEAVEEVLNEMSEQMAYFEKLVREYKPKSTKPEQEG